jgi:hypothetical protein
MSHADLQLPPKPDAQEPAIERTIGALVADAAAAIMIALAQRYEGESLSVEVKNLGGNTITQLYTMRQFGYRSLDFETVARREGKAALRERLRDAPFTPTDAQLDEWVSWPLEVLAKVVAHRLN